MSVATSRIPTKSLVDLVFVFQRAGRENRTTSRWLPILAVLAMTISTWVALVISGGTWMFYERYAHPTAELLSLKDDGFLGFYLVLASVACVFIVPTTMGLVAQSAVLGASGREQRLATLRLIGVSNGAVTRMTIVETALQALLGIAIGTIMSMATAPMWALVTFQNVRISVWEMLLPWWGYPIVLAIILVLALIAAVIGLKRVLVTPLGVSKREIPKALKWWRAIAFAAIVVCGIAYFQVIDPSSAMSNEDLYTLISLAFVLFIMLSGINLVIPLILQVIAELSSFLPGKVTFVATRRVSTNGKETWRRVSAMTFLGVLLGFVSLMPVELSPSFGDQLIQKDLFVGVIITFAIGFIIMLVSTLLNQAATVYEQASLTKALDFMGTEFSFHRRVAIRQILIPMVITGTFAFVFGMLMGFVSFGQFADNPFSSRTIVLIALYVAGVILSTLVTTAVDPLRKQIVVRQVRRND